MKFIRLQNHIFNAAHIISICHNDTTIFVHSVDESTYTRITYPSQQEALIEFKEAWAELKREA